jgi:nanoRNase/pAp phosphatase (c-di-AMP/oligoRNAs hydrolase)
MDEIVEKYIALRDAKAKLKEQYTAKAAKIESVLAKFEGVLLAQFDAQGIQSCKTTAGTAYKQKQTGATVADFTALLTFIQENEMWQMLEKRVSKLAVEEYQTATKSDEAPQGLLPPGINWREEYVINVRRS